MIAVIIPSIENVNLGLVILCVLNMCQLIFFYKVNLKIHCYGFLMKEWKQHIEVKLSFLGLFVQSAMPALNIIVDPCGAPQN